MQLINMLHEAGSRELVVYEPVQYAVSYGGCARANRGHGQHGGSVVSTVASQQEGPGFESRSSRSLQVLSVWSMFSSCSPHVLLVSAWVSPTITHTCPAASPRFVWM